MVGKIEAIFDTGSTNIIGDPVRVAKFASIIGAKAAPGYGDGTYTSTLSNVAIQSPYTLISVSQYLATSTRLSPFLLEGKKSLFLLLRSTSDLSPRTLVLASQVWPRTRV